MKEFWNWLPNYYRAYLLVALGITVGHMIHVFGHAIVLSWAAILFLVFMYSEKDLV